jgi:hypothetical protein
LAFVVQLLVNNLVVIVQQVFLMLNLTVETPEANANLSLQINECLLLINGGENINLLLLRLS